VLRENRIGWRSNSQDAARPSIWGKCIALLGPSTYEIYTRIGEWKQSMRLAASAPLRMRGLWRVRALLERIFGRRNLKKRFPQVSFGEGAIVRRADRFYPGKCCQIGVRAYLSCAGGEWSGNSGYIRLGDGCEIGPYCALFGAGGITLGNNVRMGSHVTISANQLTRDVRAGEGGAEMQFAPVVIEDNALIGPATAIAPGVRIGKNAVIGPGSAVLSDIPANAMAQGVPARVFVKKPESNDA
jgi:acetyltransferase-like isoleucine patch superfamily enzyme